VLDVLDDDPHLTRRRKVGDKVSQKGDVSIGNHRTLLQHRDDRRVTQGLKFVVAVGLNVLGPRAFACLVEQALRASGSLVLDLFPLGLPIM
jgi:hypothetical protein